MARWVLCLNGVPIMDMGPFTDGSLPPVRKRRAPRSGVRSKPLLAGERSETGSKGETGGQAATARTSGASPGSAGGERTACPKGTNDNT